MENKREQLDNLNNTVLNLIERTKVLCKDEYPDEYKIILQSLSTASKEITGITLKEVQNPLNNKTDGNNTCKNKP